MERPRMCKLVANKRHLGRYILQTSQLLEILEEVAKYSQYSLTTNDNFADLQNGINFQFKAYFDKGFSYCSHCLAMHTNRQGPMTDLQLKENETMKTLEVSVEWMHALRCGCENEVNGNAYISLNMSSIHTY